jgi:hypothetical protein
VLYVQLVSVCPYTCLTELEAAQVAVEDRDDPFDVDGQELLEALIVEATRRGQQQQQQPGNVLPAQLLGGGGGNAGRWPARYLEPKSRYGLHRDDTPQTLEDQITLFVKTLLADGCDKLRKGITKNSGRLNTKTVDRHEKDVRRFMGFLYHVLRWPKEQLGLKAFANMFAGKQTRCTSK